MNLTIKALITCLVIGGCATPTKSVKTEPTDTIVEDLVALPPLDGYWASGEFAGQFDDLDFTRLSERQNGLIVCQLEGTGELWSREGKLAEFRITGQSIGTTLSPVLELAGERIEAQGTVSYNADNLPVCRMTFVRGGRDYEADLICFGDRELAKITFLAEAKHK